MIDADARTLSVLSAALEQADHEGRLDDLVDRLNDLDSLGPDTRAVVFDRDGDIDYVVFTRQGIAWAPITHGCLVSRVASRASRVAAA